MSIRTGLGGLIGESPILPGTDPRHPAPRHNAAMTTARTRVLFICMGNICRSPAAEAVFLHRLATRGLEHRFDVESAGTGGWHAGEAADPRSRAEGNRRGYQLVTPARQVTGDDFDRFDLLVCMDMENAAHLMDRGAPDEKVRLLLEWHPESRHREVPDPYYGGVDGFAHMYDLIEAAIDPLLDDLLARDRRS